MCTFRSRTVWRKTGEASPDSIAELQELSRASSVRFSSMSSSHRDQLALEELKDWVLQAKFRDVPDNPALAICVDDKLPQILKLVAQMDFAKDNKVGASPSMLKCYVLICVQAISSRHHNLPCCQQSSAVWYHHQNSSPSHHSHRRHVSK